VASFRRCARSDAPGPSTLAPPSHATPQPSTNPSVTLYIHLPHQRHGSPLPLLGLGIPPSRPPDCSCPRPPTLQTPPPDPHVSLSTSIPPPHFLPLFPLLPRGRHAIRARTTPPASPLALLHPASSPSSRHQTEEHRARIRPCPTTNRLRSLAPTHPPPCLSMPLNHPPGGLPSTIQCGRPAPELVPSRALPPPSPHTCLHTPTPRTMPGQRPPCPPILSPRQPDGTSPTNFATVLTAPQAPWVTNST